MTRPALMPAAALLVVACATGCGLFTGPGDPPKDVAVTAVRGPLEVAVPASGYLTALNASPIAVPRVPTGALKVKELVDEGSIVAEGDIVVVFDDTQLNIDLDNHRASFRSSGRQIDRNSLQSSIESGGIEVMRHVAEMERDYATAFGDLDGSIYSRQEILESEVRKDNAEETILFADASLLLRGEYYDIEERILGLERDQVHGRIERVETSLGQLVLRAPIGGLVQYKKNWRGSSVAVGDTIWPGNVILSIVDPTRTSLGGFLLEQDAAHVTKGAEAEVRIDAHPGRAFRGEVAMVAELSRPTERGSPVKYTEVRIDIADGDPALLKPGMKGEARIRIGTLPDAVVLPRSAIRGQGDATWVLVAGDESSERRPVKLGLGDMVRVSIDDGLSGGERVLLGGVAPEAPTTPVPDATVAVPAATAAGG